MQLLQTYFDIKNILTIFFPRFTTFNLCLNMYIILNFLKDKSACWPNPCDGRTRCVTAAYNNQPICLRYGKFDERGEDINFIYKNLVNTANLQ